MGNWQSAMILPLAIGFITPAFAAAGLALVSIPIVIHLLNRRRYRVVPWAAMEYLLQAMRKNRRRLKFEQWMLLAVRCLVLALLGLALARPLGCEDSTIASLAGQRTGLHVFVIDNSYSMGYEADRPGAKTHLDQAKLIAKSWIDRLASGGESVAVVTAASPAAAPIASPTYNLQSAKDAIDRIEQTNSSTDLAGALQKALEIVRQEGRQPKRLLHIFSDSTKSAFDTGASQAVKQASQQLAKMFTIRYHNLGKQQQWNHAVLDVKPTVNLVTTRFPVNFAVSPKGFGTGPDAAIQYKMDDALLPGGLTTKLDPDTKDLVLPNIAVKAGGAHVLSARVISSDRLRADDTHYRIIDASQEIPVLIVEGDRQIGILAGSAAFLQTALAPPKEAGGEPAAPGAPPKSDSPFSPQLISDLELANKALSDYRVVILANVGQLQVAQADQLQKFVQGGGLLMLFMGDQVSGENYTSMLLPRGLLPGPLMRRVSVAPDQKPFTFAFNPSGNVHPLLKAFERQPDTGLNTAEITTYWSVDIPANSNVERVLNYEQPSAPGQGKPGDGDAGITVHPLGLGRVLYVSTSANDAWNKLPAKQNYLTLIHELINGSVRPADDWMNLTVGSPVVIPPYVKLTSAPTLVDPNKMEVVVEQVTAAATGPSGAREASGLPTYRSRPLTRPGIYQLSTGSQTFPIAVNAPAADEADVRTIDERAVRAALGDVDVSFDADQTAPAAAIAAAGNDFGWNFMLLLLLLVCAESIMAMTFGHYRRK